MASKNDVNINLNISGDFKAKIREYVRLITHAKNVVKGLKATLESLAGAGDKGFDSKHITDSLASVQKVFAGFQKISGDDLRKATEALDPTKLRAFGSALTVFQADLTAELATRVNSFASSLKGLGEAQKSLDSSTLVQQLNALSHAMPALKQAITSENFKKFAEDVKSLHINTQDIAGIIRLGAALKNINRFSGNANSLSELARGITNLTRIKETSGFLRNVQNIATAGTLLHDMRRKRQ